MIKIDKENNVYKLFGRFFNAISPTRMQAGRDKLQHMIDAAGLPLTTDQVSKAILSTDIALSMTLTLFEIYFFMMEGVESYLDIAVYVGVVWILSFVLFLLLLWMGFFFYLDLRKIKLKKELSRLHNIVKGGDEEKDMKKEVKPILWRKSVVAKVAGMFKKKGENKEEEEKEIKFEVQKQKITKHDRIRRMHGYFEKADYAFDFYHASKHIFRLVIILMGIITVYQLAYFSITHSAESIKYVIAIAVIIWVPVFLITLIVLWMAFVIYVDIRIFKRRLAIEAVLPDFLQLTSSNIRAGMTIDRALWFAVRPRFGVLAKEIEEVAKRTLSGEPLKDSLKLFANKYDSTILKRSIDILIEGVEAGGDVGDLLNKISINIQEISSMKKEMSANVTTYVIFIGFASIVAAPVLFALSTHLLIVVNSITANLDTTSTAGGSFMLSVSTEGGINLGDYKWFSRVSLLLTAIFSSMIVGTITKGNIKETAHYIPIFIVTSQVTYLIGYFILGLMLGGMF